MYTIKVYKYLNRSFSIMVSTTALHAVSASSNLVETIILIYYISSPLYSSYSYHPSPNPIHHFALKALVAYKTK